MSNKQSAEQVAELAAYEEMLVAQALSPNTYSIWTAAVAFGEKREKERCVAIIMEMNRRAHEVWRTDEAPDPAWFTSEIARRVRGENGK